MRVLLAAAALAAASGCAQLAALLDVSCDHARAVVARECPAD